MGKTLQVEIVSKERVNFSKTQSGLQKLGRAAGIAGAAIAGGLAVAFKVGMDELVASQKVIAQTEAVIKSTGGQANVTAAEVDELAQQLLELSGVDDELIAGSENLLLTFRNIHNEVGAGNDIFDQATLATLDLSVAMGKDLNSSAILVGKALNDPILGMTSLRRVGVSLTKGQQALVEELVASGDVMGAQKVILKELTKEFGGSAAAAGETLPAELSKAREAFADITSEMIAGILPALTSLLGHLQRFLDYLKEHPALAKAVVIALAALAAALLTASVAQLALNLAVLANPYVLAAAAIIAYGVVIAVLIKKFDFARKHWQLFLLAIPGIGIAAVIVATAVKFMVRHFDTLVAVFNKVRSVATAVFNAVKGKVQDAMGAVRDAFNAARDTANAVFGRIKEAVQSAIDIFNKIKGMAGGAFSTVADAIRTVLGPLGTAISLAGDLLDLIARIAGSGGTGSPVGSANPRGGGVGGIATGGHIARTGLAVVHRGEDVVSARVVRRGGGGSGGSGSVNVIVLGGDREAIAYLQGLDMRSKRGGGRGLG